MAKTSGMVGFWSDDHQMVKAAKTFRDAGFKKFDGITPFPVHGLEEAIGIKRSFIPWVTFIAGSIGCAFGVWLQWWTMSVDWPMNIGGKPSFSLPAYIPVAFETTVLLGALSSVAALFIMAGIPNFRRPVIDPDLTSHRFALFIPENDVGYERGRVEQMLKDGGADEVRFLSEF